ncbi:MAG: hypothetical protein K2Z25_05615 [Beijerinckiaceae bacterium]|nr:hypothetical protein [Beijerinckiaceae bacterium]
MPIGQTPPIDGRIRLQLYGPFRVLSPDGVDLTPASAKSCALLAMLAIAPGLRRGRSWIQNRLWSDRRPAQAAGSLRQALLDIRRALGRHAGALVSTRVVAQLIAERVEIEPRPAQTSEELAFLQGLDVNDLAFRTWLREMRGLRADGAGTAAAPASPDRRPVRPTLVVEIASEPELSHGFFSRLLYDQIARSLTESADVDVVRGPLPIEQSLRLPEGALSVQAHIATLPGGSIWLRLSLEDMARTAIRWSSTLKLPAPIVELDDNPPVLGLIHRLVFAAIEALSSYNPTRDCDGDYRAAIMAASAFRRMFRLRHQDLEASAALLDHAIAIAPRGLYHAMRAQLSTIRAIERQSCAAELRELSEADIAAALASEPLNSSVLSAAANTKLVFDNDVASSLILSRQGVRSNRSNPLAWWSLANAALYAGDHEAAYSAAVFAQQLADSSSLKPWADFQRSLTAAVHGRIDEGVAFAMSAHVLSPSFRPPLRYLIALQARSGAVTESRDAVRKLGRLEVDFSVERLISDPAYPASMLRRSRLADADIMKRIEL